MKRFLSPILLLLLPSFLTAHEPATYLFTDSFDYTTWNGSSPRMNAAWSIHTGNPPSISDTASDSPPCVQLRSGVVAVPVPGLDIAEDFELTFEARHTAYQRLLWVGLFNQTGTQGYGVAWDSSAQGSWGNVGHVSIRNYNVTSPSSLTFYHGGTTLGGVTGSGASNPTSGLFARFRLTWSKDTGTLSLYVNDILRRQSVDITLQGFSRLFIGGFDGGLIDNVAVRIPYGADVPWTTLEARSAIQNGELLASTTYRHDQIANEAVSRSCVRLSASGHYLRWTIPSSANAIVVRHCIPDAAAGGGRQRPVALWVNGQYRQNITLNSRHTWLYGTSENSHSNNPAAGGTPHVYFDDARAFISGAPLNAGDTVELRWIPLATPDPGNDWIVVDLIDLENVAPAPAIPADHLSVVSYGAVPDDGIDDTAAILNCITAAKAASKGVWLPPGTYHQNAVIPLAGVKLRGAGPWHTCLTTLTMPVETAAGSGSNWGGNLGFKTSGTGTEIRDLMIEGLLTARSGLKQHGFTGSGTNLLVQNVWVEHTDTGGWLGKLTNATIRNCRFRNTYADGFNVNNGSINVLVEHNHTRNTGDDGLAAFSNTDSGSPTNLDVTIRRNTSDAAWWGHGIAIYGGCTTSVKGNLVRGSSRNHGIIVSTLHNAWTCEDVAVIGNALFDCGGMSWSNRSGAIGIDLDNTSLQEAVLRDNVVERPAFFGLRINGGSINPSLDVTLDRNRIGVLPPRPNIAAVNPVLINADARGTLHLGSNTLIPSSSGDTLIRNDAPSAQIVVSPLQ